MVIVQLVAFGRIQDNRVAIKAKRAAKLERRRILSEKSARIDQERRALMGQIDGAFDCFEDADQYVSPCTHGRAANGTPKMKTEMAVKHERAKDLASKKAMDSETSGELTETSEEELFI